MGKRITLVVLLLLPWVSYSQTVDNESEMPVIQRSDSTIVGQVDTKKVKFTPYIAPVVSPEVGAMLVGGGLVSFKLEADDARLQWSSIPFSIGYSSNGSLSINFRPTIFGKDDKYRISGDIWLKNMPDNYWGVGYEKALQPSEPDSTTEYHRNWWQVFLKTVFKIKPNFYAGILFDMNQTVASDMSLEMRTDPNVIRDGTNIKNWSFGLLAQYDTRDFNVNAYKGLFLELSSNFYVSELFGENNYQIVILDYRQYQTIKRKGSTLAWQVKSRLGADQVPWPEMSMVGTPFDLRGYRWGRYRDKVMLLGLLEYRYMFMRKHPRKDGNMMSRFGLVGWLGTGSIGNTVPDMTNWLPNGGFGFRFEIQTRMNVRIDYGIGNDTSALYVSFNEAF